MPDETLHTHTLPDGSTVTHAHEAHEHEHREHGHEHTEHAHEHTEHRHEHAEHEHEHTEHEHEHSHGEHGHHHTNTKAVINRMNRAIGHMESIKHMVEDGRDCSEVLIQIAAVRSAINNIGKIILEDHINHCLVDAVETGDKKVLEDLNDAINKFVK